MYCPSLPCERVPRRVVMKSDLSSDSSTFSLSEADPFFSGIVRSPGSLVLGADTVVVVDDQILGKPRDQNDSCRMLRLLNGRWDQVLTGVALVNDVTGQSKVAHEVTEVRFAVMSDEEINWYVATGEPMDKAGAYAIQGHGALFIKEIRGDYFNVVGLPVRLLYRLIGG